MITLSPVKKTKAEATIRNVATASGDVQFSFDVTLKGKRRFETVGEARDAAEAVAEFLKLTLHWKN